MKKHQIKQAAITFAAFTLTTLLLQYFSSGLPVFGKPAEETLQFLTAINHRTGQMMETSDPETIHLAYSATSWLRWQLGMPEEEQADITLTFLCGNGSSWQVSAGAGSFTVNGKRYFASGAAAQRFYKIVNGLLFIDADPTKAKIK